MVVFGASSDAVGARGEDDIDPQGFHFGMVFFSKAVSEVVECPVFMDVDAPAPAQ